MKTAQAPKTLQGQWTPWRAVDSSYPCIVPVQRNCTELCKRTQVGFTLAPGTPAPRNSSELGQRVQGLPQHRITSAPGMPTPGHHRRTHVFPPGFALASPPKADAARPAPTPVRRAFHGSSPPWDRSVSASPRPHGHCDASPRRIATSPSVVHEQSLDGGVCGEGQQKMTHIMSGCNSQDSTAASSVCLSRDFSDTSNDSLQKTMNSLSHSTSNVSMVSPNVLHLRNDSLRLQNQVLALRLHKATCQLQHQQKMVHLLMKQLQKEQGRRHSMEDALLESCSCCAAVNHQLTFDSGRGH